MNFYSGSLLPNILGNVTANQVLSSVELELFAYDSVLKESYNCTLSTSQRFLFSFLFSFIKTVNVYYNLLTDCVCDLKAKPEKKLQLDSDETAPCFIHKILNPMGKRIVLINYSDL